MAEDEVAALKEALLNQLLIINRLHAELEEERQASASGADEALTMISRLQKEKAEEKMEACQYKQIAESKMHHAEESLAMLEQVICQRDIEIASLKHQVQGLQYYTQILLSGVVNNTDIIGLSENQWFSSSSFLERTNSRVQVRRQTSMPSILLTKLCSEIAINEGDCSLLPALSICRGIGESQCQFTEHQRQHVYEKYVGNESNSDVNQVHEVNTSTERLLQTQIEQKAGYSTMSANSQFQINIRQSFEEESTPCSWHSAESGDMLSSSCLEAESIGNTIQYNSNQHMIEIPQSNNGCLLRKSSKKVLQEPHREAEQMIGIPESRAEGTASCSLGDDDISKRALKLCTLRNGTPMNCQPNLVEQRDQTVAFQSDVEQLKCQVQQLADDMRIMKQEDLKKGKEQLKLLWKIHEQLKLVQPQIQNSKSKKACPQDEDLFVILTEAMLSFSI